MNLSSTINDLALPLHEAAKDPKVWGDLKQAISTSSGFDKWQSSRHGDPKNDPKDNFSKDTQMQESVLDDLVRSYLRETLETLAY